jgi:hypothetical protein
MGQPIGPAACAMARLGQSLHSIEGAGRHGRSPSARSLVFVGRTGAIEAAKAGPAGPRQGSARRPRLAPVPVIDVDRSMQAGMREALAASAHTREPPPRR